MTLIFRFTEYKLLYTTLTIWKTRPKLIYNVIFFRSINKFAISIIDVLLIGYTMTEQWPLIYIAIETSKQEDYLLTLVAKGDRGIFVHSV